MWNARNVYNVRKTEKKKIFMQDSHVSYVLYNKRNQKQ